MTQRTTPHPIDILRAFMERVWNTGDLAAVDEYLAERYTIHSDPGDTWEGQTLTRDGFRDRLLLSRSAFPDLRFDIEEWVADGDRVVIAWTMHGTNTGAIAARPATQRRMRARGMTVYYFSEGRVTGHRQVVDRLAVAQQLGLLG